MSKISQRKNGDPDNHGLVLYQTRDGKTRIEVRFEGETVWLTQSQMAELFQTTKQNISLHIQNVFDEGELSRRATVKDYLTVQSEGDRHVQRQIEHYNLDVIISVGYRVKSHRGTQFRIWATQRLREYLIKGFALDDERLKKAGGEGYFEELLARIRDIRSSEKVFWKKVLDIYATSVDYDPNEVLSQQFFAVVQNKMHWAAHGHTAAEIIHQRANAALPHMGLTSWAGSEPRKSDAGIAKNYLTSGELEGLNRIVTAYLEFAELQARGRKLMYMRDWIKKLDDFLRLTEHEILTHAGQISHEAALAKAEIQYDQYAQKQVNEPSPVEKHFEAAVEKIKKFTAQKPRKLKRDKTP